VTGVLAFGVLTDKEPVNAFGAGVAEGGLRAGKRADGADVRVEL
jgi:hypothetical protein